MFQMLVWLVTTAVLPLTFVLHVVCDELCPAHLCEVVTSKLFCSQLWSCQK